MYSKGGVPSLYMAKFLLLLILYLVFRACVGANAMFFTKTHYFFSNAPAHYLTQEVEFYFAVSKLPGGYIR